MRDYSPLHEIKPGKRIFVQHGRFRARARGLIGVIRANYLQPASIFYHFLKSSGHIAALRRHKNSAYVSRFDIDNFFQRVTRAKIHRALRGIGIRPKAAWEIAYVSVVPQHGVKCLPFGFIQSPLLATLALEKSLLGAALIELGERLHVSVYMDDILVSGNRKDEVEHASYELLAIAEACRFPFSAHKSQIAQREVIAFNCHVGSGKLQLTRARLEQFAAEYELLGDGGQAAICQYINAVSINDLKTFASMVRRLVYMPNGWVWDRRPPFYDRN